MKKYYYTKGMCKVRGYLGLYPVLYKRVSDKTYTKIEMECSAIEKGECDKKKTCPLFIESPDEIEDNGINLRDEKY